MEIETGIV